MTTLRTLVQLSLAGGDGNGSWGTTLRWRKGACAAVLLCAAMATVAAGQSFKSLASFDGSDGSYPNAGLVQAANGNFYGTASSEGANGLGTVFEITPAGKLTTLYSFCSQTNCTDGQQPEAGLVQATNGNLYGTTYYGGANGLGTVFEITPAGKLTTLYSFCSQTNCTDGQQPEAGLVQASDGNFFGTTPYGGEGSGCGMAMGCGTVFEITPAGNLTTLYSFCSQTNCADGQRPAWLVQATKGNFYGTTGQGGSSSACLGGCGTVFTLSAGLGPFVETIPTAAKVATRVTILGNKLTGTTSVTFNGTPVTSFTVNHSGNAITTTVPSGATGGYVQVTTESGTVLTSNVKFRVLP